MWSFCHRSFRQIDGVVNLDTIYRGMGSRISHSTEEPDEDIAKSLWVPLSAKAVRSTPARARAPLRVNQTFSLYYITAVSRHSMQLLNPLSSSVNHSRNVLQTSKVQKHRIKISSRLRRHCSESYLFLVGKAKMLTKNRLNLHRCHP